MTSRFAHRGIVEGFYGPPWAHEDRLWWIDRLGDWGLDRYVHAPKDDPLHRAEWRTRYPDAERRRFAELIERGHARGVEVGFAVSPGLSMVYSSARDVAALVDKLADFAALGARFFSLALDDVPTRLVHEPDRRAFRSLGEAHVAVARAVREALGDGVALWLVPTDYLGVEPTDYLEELGAGLPPDVEVGWTGRTVVSPAIRADEARRRAATLRRRLLVWDNYPVADGPMRSMLHWGPYRGRDAALAESVAGVLLNPMQHARASALAVHTAAAWLRDPDGYDPERAWRAALDELGGDAREALAAFASAHRFSALAPDDRDPELEAAWRDVEAGLGRGAPDREALARALALAEERVGAAQHLRDTLADRRLLAEIGPWLEAHETESRRIEAALRALERLAAAPDRLARALVFMAFEGRLTRLPAPAVASYGPRRVLYPQLTSMREDAAGFGDDPALFVDRCLADDCVRAVEAFALARLRA